MKVLVIAVLAVSTLAFGSESKLPSKLKMACETDIEKLAKKIIRADDPCKIDSKNATDEQIWSCVDHNERLVATKCLDANEDFERATGKKNRQ